MQASNKSILFYKISPNGKLILSVAILLKQELFQKQVIGVSMHSKLTLHCIINLYKLQALMFLEFNIGLLLQLFSLM